MQEKRFFLSWSFFIVSILICLISIAITVFTMSSFHQKNTKVTAVSKDGVIHEIQKLGRLQSTAFGVDTVITTSKEGTWQKLWQDEQKGLFVAHGRVLAGVDLAKITPQMVEIAPKNPNDATTQITINLPAPEIFAVYLDNLELYDWQTGLFGVVNNDPEILEQAQNSAKNEVLKKACQGEILSIGAESAKEQIKRLFALTDIHATVTIEQPQNCTLTQPS